jgi:UDP-3-O-[3-hydroxymyristoyl] glucosamine N-acyltransferase
MVKNLSTIDRSEKIRLGKNTSDYQPENTIVLNATPEVFPSLTANSFYVAPLRFDFDQRATSNTIVYNFVTKEIVDIGPGSRVSLEDVLITGNVTTNTAVFNNTFTGLVTLSNVGIGNANPIHLLDVGNNFYVNEGGDVWIGGELFVEGNTSTINTQNLTIKDPIIELARNNPGINDIGVMMTRTVVGSNVGVIFKESSDELSFGYTQSNASAQNIAFSSSTPLKTKFYGNTYTTGSTHVGRWHFNESETPIQTITYNSSNVNVTAPVTGTLNMTIQSTQLGFGNELIVTINGTQVGTVNDISPGPVTITEEVIKGDVIVINTNFGFGFVISNYTISYINTVFSLTTYDETNAIAIYDASKFGILQDIPTHTLDVGSNLYVQDSGTSNVLGVTGNAYISGDLTVGGDVTFSNDFVVVQNLTSSNNITATANIDVGYDLNVTGNAFISSNVIVTGNTDVRSELNVDGNVFVASNVIVSGNTDVQSELNVDGNVFVTGNTDISSELNVSGNVFVSSNAIITGNTDVQSELNVDGNVFVGSNVIVTGNTDVRSELNVDGNVFVGSNVIVTGNTDISSELNVIGNVFVSSNAVITGNTDIQSELNVDGNVFVASNVVVSGNTDIESELNVTGNVFVSSNAVITGNTDIESELNVTGNVFVASNVIVSGNTDIESELNVTGNVFVASNVVVTGNTDVQSELNVDGNVFVASNVIVSGNTDIESELNVSGNVFVLSNAVITGNTDISSELNVAGNVFAASNIVVSGNTDVQSELNVDGNIFARSNVIVTGNTDVQSELNVSGNVFVASNVVVTGNTDVESELNVTGNVFVDSNVVVTNNVHAARYYGDGGHLANVTLQVVSDKGNTTSNTIQFTNATTALTTDLNSNVGIKVDQLANVVVTNPEADHLLVYDGSNWVNDFNVHNFIKVHNTTGTTLYRGNAVYIVDSFNNNVANVALAKSDSASTMPTIGLIYENILDGAEGVAVAYGKVNGLNTLGYTEGDTVYVSNVGAGLVMQTKPYGLNDQIQNVGVCIKAHENNGVIFVTGVGRSNDIPNAPIETTTSPYVYVNTANNNLRKIVPANLLTKLQTLEQVTNTGNTISNVVQFTNATTGIVTTSNIEVGSNLAIHGITPAHFPVVGDDQFLKKSTISLANGSTVIASNLEVVGDISVTGNSYIVSSNNLVIDDRVLGIANNNTSHTLDVGIVMQHPGKNIALVHHGEDGDAHEHEFTIGYTQNTVSDNSILDDTSNIIEVRILGNLVTQNNITVDAAGTYYGNAHGLSNITLQQVTQYGNTTANTIEFTNTVSFVTSSNVGIANTSPEHTMGIGSNLYIDDVGSNIIHATGNVYATRFIGDGYFLSNIASNLELIVTNGNVTSETVSLLNTDISLTTTGPVGIINTAPTHTLSVASNVYFDDTGSNVMHATGNIYATRFIGDGYFLSNIASNLELIATNGNVTTQTISIENETLGLITTGPAGIANNSPAHTLSVGSNVYISDTGSNVLVVEGNVLASKITLGNVSITPAYTFQQISATGNTTSYTVEFNNADTSLVTASNVGIATTSPAYTLEVNGDAAKTGGGTWTSTSDARLKENIQDANLETCYDTVKNLKLRRFRWRDDVEGITDKNVIGWIAQEVEEVLPKSVTTVGEKYGLEDVKFLNADQIYAAMFGTIQKLIEDKERLETQVAELMKR